MYPLMTKILYIRYSIVRCLENGKKERREKEKGKQINISNKN